MDPGKLSTQPGHNSEDFGRIVERMAKAGWITGNNLPAPAKLNDELTDHGRIQMTKAAEAIIEAAPQSFSAESTEAVMPKDLSLLDSAKLTVRVSAAVRELTKPDMSDSEADTMMSILVTYAWQLSRERLSDKTKTPPD